MGYLFIVIVLFMGALKGFFGKKTGNYANDTQSSALLSLIRMLFCAIFSLLLVLLPGNASALVLDPKMLPIFAFSGIGTALFVVSWLLAVRKNAYMLLDVFLMSGTLLPMLVGSIAFGETIVLRQWIGFGILIVAVVIMCSYNKSIKKGITPASLLLLLLCGFSNGVADASQKAFASLFPKMPVSVFNFYTYVFAFITLALFFGIISFKHKPSLQKGDFRLVFVYVLIMSVALTAHSYFKTLAAFYLDSARLYPLNQAGSLILSTLMARFLFKEKMPIKAIVGIAISFLALLLINL